MAKAVLIVDMLNDFVEEDGKLQVPGAKKIVEKIGQLRGAAYEQGVYVVYANDAHTVDDPEFQTFPEHAVQGTYGAQIITQLQPARPALEKELVINKQDLSVFTNPEADRMLKQRGIDELLVTGVATEYCVRGATLDALARQYRVNVVVDAIAGVDINPGDQYRALLEMGNAGAKPIYANQALEQMVKR